MPTTRNTRDLIRVATLQESKARTLFGNDFLTAGLGPVQTKIYPSTRRTYAALVYDYWLSATRQVLDQNLAVFTRNGAITCVGLAGEKGETAEALSGPICAARISGVAELDWAEKTGEGLLSMAKNLDAETTRSLGLDPNGVLLPNQVVGFWESVKKVALNLSSQQAQVTETELWNEFKSAIEEQAQEIIVAAGRSLRGAAELVGKATGNVLAGAFQGAGLTTVATGALIFWFLFIR